MRDTVMWMQAVALQAPLGTGFRSPGTVSGTVPGSEGHTSPL